MELIGICVAYSIEKLQKCNSRLFPEIMYRLVFTGTTTEETVPVKTVDVRLFRVMGYWFFAAEFLKFRDNY